MIRAAILVIGSLAWLRVGYLLREGMPWVALTFTATCALWAVWALAHRIWGARP